MTEQRKDEIIRRVFYRHADDIMRCLEVCEDTHVIFQVGMNMGWLHSDLENELSKECQNENSD